MPSNGPIGPVRGMGAIFGHLGLNLALALAGLTCLWAASGNPVPARPSELSGLWRALVAHAAETLAPGAREAWAEDWAEDWAEGDGALPDAPAPVAAGWHPLDDTLVAARDEANARLGPIWRFVAFLKGW
jgi:hypothetical protein